MTFIASTCQAVETQFKLRCVSPEYEILLLLYELKTATPTDLLSMQKPASSTFYKCIGTLQHKGLINIERDVNDRRYSLYSLTDFARGVLDEKWNRIQAWTRGRAPGESGTLSEP